MRVDDIFTIRPAILSDAPEIAALSDVLGYPVTENAMIQRLQQLLDREADSVLVAALPSGHIVGWLHGAAQNLLESGRRCEILGLVVDPRHRTRGIGSQLVAAIEAWAASLGLEQITVRSNVQRSESHLFYDHLGYARTKTQHVYRKRLSSQSTV